jgi:hypothetical protein
LQVKINRNQNNEQRTVGGHDKSKPKDVEINNFRDKSLYMRGLLA